MHFSSNNPVLISNLTICLEKALDPVSQRFNFNIPIMSMIELRHREIGLRDKPTSIGEKITQIFMQAFRTQDQAFFQEIRRLKVIMEKFLQWILEKNSPAENDQILIKNLFRLLSPFLGTQMEYLTAAILSNHAHSLANLLHAGCNANEVILNGHTSLRLATEKGHTDCVQILLNAPGFDLKRNNQGAAALKAAVHPACRNLIQKALDAASPPEAVEAKEGTPPAAVVFRGAPAEVGPAMAAAALIANSDNAPSYWRFCSIL